MVEIDHTSGNKALLTTAAKLGFSLGTEEMRRFKESVSDNDTYSYDETFAEGSFSQWVADNADHNARTLDGLNTFHLMGIIECANFDMTSENFCP